MTVTDPNNQVQHYLRCVLDVTGTLEFKDYAGDFARKLTELALKCDHHNFRLLSLAFPEVTVAVSLWRANPGRALRLARAILPREEKQSEVL